MHGSCGGRLVVSVREDLGLCFLEAWLTATNSGIESFQRVLAFRMSR